jgi:hydrogenase maturation protease
VHLVRHALPAPGGGAALSGAAICLGNRFRGDDAVGPLAGDRLRAAGATVLECADEPTRLLDRWQGLDTVVVVDAVRSGAAPGTLHRVDAGDGSLPRDLALASTHAVGIADALALGRVLGRAPRRVVVLGVEGASYALGEPPSPEVAGALEALVDAVLDELDEEAGCTSGR